MPRKKWVEAVDGPRTLTAKQRRFVEEYVVDMNAHRAALRAGYKVASSSAVNLFRRPEVARAVSLALRQKAERACVDADKVMGQLTKLAFTDLLDLMRRDEDGMLDLDLDRLTRETAPAVSRLRIEYYPDQGERRRIRRISLSLADKTSALRELARHLGLYRDKLDVTVRKQEPEPVCYVVTGVPRHPDRRRPPPSGAEKPGSLVVVDPAHRHLLDALRARETLSSTAPAGEVDRRASDETVGPFGGDETEGADRGRMNTGSHM